MQIIQLESDDRPQFQSSLKELEQLTTYPLGDDSFRIDHGDDYFAFFDRLGETSYYVAHDNGKIMGVAAAVLRTIDRKPVWYLCDLKVHPSHRGQRLPFKIALKAFLSVIKRSRQLYYVSMNPPGKPNHVVTLTQRFKLLRVTTMAPLQIYSCSYDQMQIAHPILSEHRGRIGFLSLAGKKDIVLSSTEAPMPLLHVQFGQKAEITKPAPQKGAVHMFCVLEDDPMNEAIKSAGLQAGASASVVHHGMEYADWKFILTSDI